MRYLILCLFLILSLNIQAQKTPQLTLSLYPNPTTELVNLKFSQDLPSGDIVKITLTEILGNQIKTFELKNELESRFSMIEFNAGIYLLKIETQHAVFIKKILFKP